MESQPLTTTLRMWWVSSSCQVTAHPLQVCSLCPPSSSRIVNSTKMVFFWATRWHSCKSCLPHSRKVLGSIPAANMFLTWRELSAPMVAVSEVPYRPDLVVTPGSPMHWFLKSLCMREHLYLATLVSSTTGDKGSCPVLM